MGFNLNDEFPSNYLKAADLEGQTVAAEISDIKKERIGDDDKLVVYFKGKHKGLVLNKTNANNIALVYGMDTDGWIGGAIQIYPTMVDFQGRSMEALRVKAMVNRPKKAPPSKHPQQGFSDTGPTKARHDDTEEAPF